jgi:hypothetical protein
MTRARDVANVLTAASNLATDTETAAAISTHAALSDPHTGYLKESEYVAAGKNKILNGDFSIWQRGVTGGNGFLADRWYLNAGAPTSFSQTRQAFTPGTAPVAGYEGKYFWRNTITTVGPSTEWYLNTYIEDVQTLAGQTATFSFWAKADSARAMSGYFLQRFGDGGSTTVSTTIGTASLTTAWQRFTFTISVPSISGKTIGANNLVQIFFAMTPASGMVIDLWGVQLESGSVATPFTTATGNQALELAACQRYYYRIAGTTYTAIGFGSCFNSTNYRTIINFPTFMRSTPGVAYGGTLIGNINGGNILPTGINYISNSTGIGCSCLFVDWIVSGQSAGANGSFYTNNTGLSNYVEFSAEL